MMNKSKNKNSESKTRSITESKVYRATAGTLGGLVLASGIVYGAVKYDKWTDERVAATTAQMLTDGGHASSKSKHVHVPSMELPKSLDGFSVVYPIDANTDLEDLREDEQVEIGKPASLNFNGRDFRDHGTDRVMPAGKTILFSHDEEIGKPTQTWILRQGVTEEERAHLDVIIASNQDIPGLTASTRVHDGLLMLDMTMDKPVAGAEKGREYFLPNDMDAFVLVQQASAQN